MAKICKTFDNTGFCQQSGVDFNVIDGSVIIGRSEYQLDDFEIEGNEYTHVNGWSVVVQDSE